MEGKERYSRLLALKEMGEVEDFSVIKKAKIVVVGIGGVGSVVSEMLARCGVGELVLCDYDNVEIGNMNRLFYRPCHDGLSKVKAAGLTLREINEDVIVTELCIDITKIDGYNKLRDMLLKDGCCVDLVLSCVDNFTARMTINKLCNELNQIWMNSGVSENALSGQIQFMVPGRLSCFHCAPPNIVALDGDEKTIKKPSVCTASLPTTMGIIAGFLAHNVLKYFLHFGNVTDFLAYNSKQDFIFTQSIAPNPDCQDQFCRLRQSEYKECENLNNKKQEHCFSPTPNTIINLHPDGDAYDFEVTSSGDLSNNDNNNTNNKKKQNNDNSESNLYKKYNNDEENQSLRDKLRHLQV